ncbi:FadR/GntR family transcriptional regulator [Bacillus benzoevorans]|uniref:GntR family transcriptional repressor for pyruvate dehydrogenase complex n=1 Tax=Bacillus benzoevorans TaxID=1456 RepID=A0A7X0HN40_9BACI|nr:FadR/GntR family transcriptional regulator [Bacillus benzoevorans]MBB6443641.1 GntR family transcriptional repressor for pyruvate dehydrogenase complex [Bacillus benzoevorans]
MQYKQIKPKKIYEEVAEALHEGIRSGVLKPGDKLDSVQQLAENFQVGRSAIREALSALKAMGLIEMRQGEGTYVKQFEESSIKFPLSTAMLMNKDDVMNLLEVRKIIEKGAAMSAALRRTPENINLMKEALEEMRTAHGNEELGEKSDLKFHLAVASSTQNSILVKLLNDVSDLMQQTMKETRRIWLYSKHTTVEQLYEEHLAIFEAVLEKNEDKARKAMETHLNNVEVIIQKYFDETRIDTK